MVNVRRSQNTCIQETGPHLYEVSPSGNFFDYFAVSIGARSQSAKTYLEKHHASFPDATLDELIVHGLRALRDTLQTDKELTTANCSVGVVGEGGVKFNVIEGDALSKYLASVDAPAEGGGAAGGGDVAPVEGEAVGGAGPSCHRSAMSSDDIYAATRL